MQKNDLLKHNDSIIRILDIKDNQLLIIDCIKRTMPKWINAVAISDYIDCMEEELLLTTGMELYDLDSLDTKSKRFAHEHYTLIAGILPFVSDEKQRSHVISAISEEKNVSKQTIRKYLCLYLAYQDMSVFAPKQETKKRKLTKDEKNMRWALNKFFYTRHKNSITTAYAMMLKEKYCDSTGTLSPEYPSIHQFRYFYRKTKKMQTYYISRNGLSNYQRNNRPLLGDGVQEFAPSIGVGLLDSTICDIYLVNESGDLIGRPILTACIDAYSSLCCGYSLTWEGGMYSLRNLMLNVISDKVEWCKKFGILIERSQWNCNKLPATLVTDMGREYQSENFEQIAELGISITNLPPYRPELKGKVEKFFDLVQNSFKPYLKGKGLIEPDYQERGVRDYRKDACLTMKDFETIILRCIIYYNSQRIVDFPYTEDMTKAKVRPYSSDIWEWGRLQDGANLITVDKEQLILTLFPRTIGKFTRFGLKVNKMRYKHKNFTEKYLNGGEVTVAYNPDDVSCVWLIENGIYIRFELVENRFQGKELSEVKAIRKEKNKMINDEKHNTIQGRINLGNYIESIASTATKQDNVNIKSVRKTRRKEQNKAHTNNPKGGSVNGQ